MGLITKIEMEYMEMEIRKSKTIITELPLIRKGIENIVTKLSDNEKNKTKG